MHEDIWKVLFKAGETPPPMTEDRGLSLKLQANSVSEKTAKKAAKGARRVPRRKGASDVMFEEETRSSSAEDEDEEEEEEDDSPPEVGRKKRAASTNLEAKAPKRGKGSLTDNSTPAWDSSPRSSSDGSLDPKERASMSPPPAYSPSAKGDDKEVSQRTSLDRGRVPEVVRVAPQDDFRAAGHMGKKSPMEADDAGRVLFDP
nr:uncharacterized protein LOC109786000 [Aegilops tauschii subsp. strangulata]